MKVAILAAGVGSRLRPLTADLPKAMVRIKDKPLVQYQVESVLASGFRHEDIYIVGGYKMERIRDYYRGTGIRFIYNPHYESMNNIYSFLLTRSIGDDLLLINSDDFYDRRMIPLLLEAPCSTCILVDRHKTLTEEAMRVVLESGRLRLISKKIDLDAADGEFIGISKLGLPELAVMYQKAESMIKAGDVHAWYENVYEACAEEIEIRAVDTQGYPWIEIDDLHDLALAEQLAPVILSSYHSSTFGH